MVLETVIQMEYSIPEFLAGRLGTGLTADRTSLPHCQMRRLLTLGVLVLSAPAGEIPGEHRMGSLNQSDERLQVLRLVQRHSSGLAEWKLDAEAAAESSCHWQLPVGCSSYLTSASPQSQWPACLVVAL